MTATTATASPARAPLPASRSIYTQAHRGWCTADCFPTYNPGNLGYAVVKNGAVQKHHTGPHARELALAQAHRIREWAEYEGESVRVVVEEFRWTGQKHERTATPVEVIAPAAVAS